MRNPAYQFPDLSLSLTQFQRLSRRFEAQLEDGLVHAPGILVGALHRINSTPGLVSHSCTIGCPEKERPFQLTLGCMPKGYHTVVRLYGELLRQLPELTVALEIVSVEGMPLHRFSIPVPTYDAQERVWRKVARACSNVLHWDWELPAAMLN